MPGKGVILRLLFDAVRRKKIPFKAMYPYADVPKAAFFHAEGISFIAALQDIALSEAAGKRPSLGGRWRLSRKAKTTDEGKVAYSTKQVICSCYSLIT
jgi:hypothetical protein